MAIYLYVNGSDRTGDLQRDSIRIKNQLQQRADSMSFTLISGTKPDENQEVRFFRGATIASFATKTVTLNSDYQTGVNFFYSGQKLKIRIGDSDEEDVIVDTYDEDNLQIVLVEAPSGTVSSGDKIGEIMFGGSIARPKTRNVVFAENIEYDIEAVDHTKLFDKKLISDTWEDVDSRYIINDFLNTTVNYNQEVDDMNYSNDAALQAVWLESADADPATVDTANVIEGTSAASFDWTFSSGTARFTAEPIGGSSTDFSDFTGVASGVPVEGYITFWYKRKQTGNITTLNGRFGSAAANNALYAFDIEEDTEWHFIYRKLSDYTSILGTPDWTAADYFRFIIAQTADGGIIIDDLRIVHDSSFFPAEVQETPLIDDLRAPRIKPGSLMQLLAQTWEYVWYIDYNRVIHFVDRENDEAPFEVTDASNNFTRLVTQVDQSQLGNRIIILGGEEISDYTYGQVFQGNSASREWILKNKFKNLVISIDDNTDTNTAEVGTSTTNVTITGHGLATGDHVVNRTRGEVREITKVDDDNFTVEAVSGQVSGDTITFFSTAKTSGIEGIVDETTVDYVQNSNEKSVRATESEATLTSTEYIRFSYNERIPIQVQYTDSASVSALKALGFGDGIFDLAPISDRNIADRSTAIAIATAKVANYSNPTIDGSYMTDQNGVKAGQIQRIQDTNRSLDEEYVIQTVSIRQKGGAYSDYFEYVVSFGTTLFGWIEFMQKLNSIQDRIEINDDAIVATFVSADEIVESDDVNQVAKDGGFKTASQAETVEASETNTVATLATGTWRYEPNGVGQTFESRYDLCDYG